MDISSTDCKTKKTILVVDDNSANLHLLTSLLREAGYDIRPAISGALALATVKLGLPDLIMLDVKMPEMDGYEVCRQLKADERTRDIPVIFVSALGESIDKVRAFNVGGVDYITKPFECEEVLARVKTHISLRSIQNHLEEVNEHLRKSHEELQRLVQERSNQLIAVSEELRAEIMERMAFEEEKRRIEKQLHQAQKMEAIGTLAGGIAHDFNNILAPIIGYTEMLIQEVPEESKSRRELKQVFKAANRAKDLVMQILTFSRQTEQEPKPLQVSLVVKEATKFLRASLPSTIEIRLSMAPAATEIKSLCDPTSAPSNCDESVCQCRSCNA